MTKPAVIEGVYVDLRFMPGLKSARVFIDVPIEYANQFLKMFDAPDRANPVRVAIARLQTVAEPLSSAPQGAPEGPIPEKRERKRSEIAALKCKDEEFGLWLSATQPAIFDKYYYAKPGEVTTPEAADSVLKEVLGIQSKKELDSDPFKAAEWDKLITSFEVRAYAR